MPDRQLNLSNCLAFSENPVVARCLSITTMPLIGTPLDSDEEFEIEVDTTGWDFLVILLDALWLVVIILETNVVLFTCDANRSINGNPKI